MAKKKGYFIRIHNSLVSVTREVYITYYGMERHLKTLEEKDQRNGLVSFDALDTDSQKGEELLVASHESVEDVVVQKIMHDKLRRCVADMPEADRQLIRSLYFENLSERQLSQKVGIPQKTINDRKGRLLKILRKNIEK